MSRGREVGENRTEFGSKVSHANGCASMDFSVIIGNYLGIRAGSGQPWPLNSHESIDYWFRWAGL